MMERLGITMAEAHLFGWHAIARWAQHLPQDSALWRARHPEHAAWSNDLGRAVILADLYDAVLHVIGIIAAAHGARPRDPKPYPRPGAKGETEHFGSGGIPVRDFDEWYNAED